MAEAKRGRLRSVTIKHKYDENGKLSGHTVQPQFDMADDNDKEAPMMSPTDNVETVHEDHADAIGKAVQFHNANAARFGGKKSKPKMNEAPMKAALARR